MSVRWLSFAARTGQNRWLMAALVLTMLVAGGVAGARAQAPAYNIYQLQHSGPEWNWQSPLQGEIVKCTGGIVTHKFRQRIVIQDPSLGSEWAAIEVRGYPVYPTGISIGDQVDFDNVYVDEYRGVTTLQYYSASSHVVNSGGHPLPAPVPVSARTLRYPAHPEDTEKYASMLVSFGGPVSVGDLNQGAHQDNYTLLGQSGDIVWGSDYANTDIDSTYYVSSGDCYVRLVGLVQRYTYDGWDYYQLLPRGIGDYTRCSIAGAGRPEDGGLRLLPTSPNPAALPARIEFALPLGASVRLEVFDVAGRQVALLADGWREPGVHAVTWRGSVGSVAPMPAGIYYVRLSAGSGSVSRPLCITR
jgi:hypothetical protein